MKRHIAAEDSKAQLGDFPQPTKRPRSAQPFAHAPEPQQASNGFAQQDQVRELFVLGQGDCGQLGRGDDYLEAKSPTLSPITKDNLQVQCIAAGGVHSVVLTDGGGIFTCGVNDDGALGRRTDCKIWETAGPQNGFAQDTQSEFEWGAVHVPSTEGRPVSISAGDSHTLCVTDTGAVWGWGTFRDAGGVYGLLPDQQRSLVPTLLYRPPSSMEAVTKVVSGGTFSFARPSVGCFGTDHVLALTTGGEVLSWGTGWQGQLGRISKEHYDQFAEADREAKTKKAICEDARTKKMEVFSRPNGSSEEQSAANLAFSRAEADLQRILATFEPQEREFRRLQLCPAKISLPFRVVDIACGHNNSFVINASGELWSFGLDNYGQASGCAPKPEVAESELFIHAPELVASVGGAKVKAVASGMHHTVVLTWQGQLMTFGRATYGALGRVNDEFNENVAREKPELVDKFCTQIISIAAGEGVCGCVTAGGRAFLWGSGTNAQLGNAAKRCGWRNAGLEEGEEERLSDTDEIIPCRLESSRLRHHNILGVAFGGQHTMLLASKHLGPN